jgi:hypothetical protein
MQLKLNHGCDLGAEVRERFLYQLQRHWSDRCGFSCLRATESQALNGLEPHVRVLGNQFFGGTPFPHPLDAADPLVDRHACQGRLPAVLGMVIAIDHELPNSLESDRAEISSGDVTVKVFHRPEAKPVLFEIGCIGAIWFLVVLLGVLPEGVEQLIYREICNRAGTLPPFG